MPVLLLTALLAGAAAPTDLVLVLDRSGSVTGPQLLGELRAANDAAHRGGRVAVLAVNHRVEPVVGFGHDPAAASDALAAVEADGGGAFTYTALEAVAAFAEPVHAVLVIEAFDAEEKVQGVYWGWASELPNAYELADSLRARGFVLTVIGVGQRHDADAEFLTLLAERGGGTAVIVPATGVQAALTELIDAWHPSGADPRVATRFLEATTPSSCTITAPGALFGVARPVQGPAPCRPGGARTVPAGSQCALNLVVTPQGMPSKIDDGCDASMPGARALVESWRWPPYAHEVPMQVRLIP